MRYENYVIVSNMEDAVKFIEKFEAKYGNHTVTTCRGIDNEPLLKIGYYWIRE